ncbi:hypothetical protein B0H14DRAFT_2832589, partial [Mycena olivaceomarginata]
ITCAPKQVRFGAFLGAFFLPFFPPPFRLFSIFHFSAPSLLSLSFFSPLRYIYLLPRQPSCARASRPHLRLY